MIPDGTLADETATAGKADSIGGMMHSKSSPNLVEVGEDGIRSPAGSQDFCKTISRTGLRNSIAVTASSHVLQVTFPYPPNSTALTHLE
jgi:hypothetical protein